MKLKIFIICTLLFTLSFQIDRIDQLVTMKLQRSKPQGSDILANRYLEFSSDMGYKYSKDVKTNQLSSIKNEKYGAKIWVFDYEIYPYKEAMALKWGTKFESLSYKMRLDSSKDGFNRVDVYAMIGERKGDDCSLRTAWGISHAKSKAQTKKVSYQYCWTEWFQKKCETRYKNVERAFTLEEMTTSKIGLIRRAHQNAVTKFKTTLQQSNRLFSKDKNIQNYKNQFMEGPRSIIEFNYANSFNQSEPKEVGRQFIAYGVPNSNVLASVDSMINGTMNPTLSSLIKSKVSASKSGTFYHNTKQGKYKIELISENIQQFTIAVGI